MIIVVTPIIGVGWPALMPIVLATAGAIGFKRLTETDAKGWMRGRLTTKLENLQIVRVPVSEILLEAVSDELGHDEMLRFVNEQDGLTLVIRRDERNTLLVEVIASKDRMRQALEQIGREFAAQLVQQFVYHHTVQELERRGVLVVSEEVNDEGSIVLRTRRWE